MSQEPVADRPANNRQTASLTVRQKILLAAVECSASNERFTTDDLVLRAWQLHPESFSLGGTANAHPDSNRVLAKLAGTEGLRGLGWVELTGTSTYRVTRTGHKVAEQLRAVSAPTPELRALAPVDTSKRVAKTRLPKGPPAPKSTQPSETPPVVVSSPAQPSAPPPSPPSTIDADITAVRWGERSNALRKFLRGSPLTFADASSFWGLTARTSNASQRIAEVGARFERVTRLFEGKSVVDSRLPPLSTCYGLLNLHRLMLSRFARELEALSANGSAP